jgi:hypothetical protein
LSSHPLAVGALLRLPVALLNQHLDGLHLGLVNRPLEMLRIEIKISFILISFLTR